MAKLRRTSFGYFSKAQRSQPVCRHTEPCLNQALRDMQAAAPIGLIPALERSLSG